MNDNKNNPQDETAYLRQRAERIAQLNRDGHSAKQSSLSVEEAARTIHELQIHQIELEMQNEELRRTQVELEHERARYFDLYEMAPVGYITISKEGLILENNLTFSHMLSIARAVLFHKPISHFIFRDDQDIYYLRFKRLFETGEPQTCEIRLVKNDGSVFWAKIAASAAYDRKGEFVCRAAVSDITIQKEAETKLIYQTMHDSLTGLYNRTYFVESMEHLEQGRQYPISILMLDIDKLKHINDHYGHASGDQVLIDTAQMLRRSFRVDDVIARIGGDEFVVLMPNTPATAAEEALKRLMDALTVYNNSHTDKPLQFSCGLSTAENKMPLVNTLHEADSQMYLKKQSNNSADTKS